MRIKNLIFVLVFFPLLVACQLTVAPPPTQPSTIDVVGTAVELTAAAKFTEIASSVVPVTATFTAIPTPTLTPDSAASVSGPCSPTVTATVNANVRSGPGTAYDAVGSLMLGQTATIAGRNDAYTWWYIAYPGVSGGYAWIAGSVVTSSCVPSVVQVVAAPPLPTQEVVVADSSSNDSDAGGNADGDGGGSDDSGSTSAAPDLVAVRMQFSNHVRKDRPMEVTVTVRNQGNQEATNFTVGWWSSSPIVTGCHWSVDYLAPGASKVLSCDYTYHTSKNQDVKLMIDTGNDVVESNEDNNTITDRIIIFLH